MSSINFIHYSVGCVNSIPLPLCGSIQAHGIKYTRSRTDLVDCSRCRRVLENYGVKVPRLIPRSKTTDTDDVQIYSLPKIQRHGVRND